MSVHDWIYSAESLTNTPSRKSGVDVATESRYRREGVKLIFSITNLQPHPTLATAAVFFHRFYMQHSFRTFNRHVTAISCLFLAGKVEETPKKCRDLLERAQQIMSPEMVSRMGANPIEEVMVVERILLQTLKFDLTIEHPYVFLNEYSNIFKGSTDVADVEKLVQMTWTFLNDSFGTSLCLRWEPEIIAVACMHLGAKVAKIELNWEGKTLERADWWSAYVDDLTDETIKSIVNEVLDLYNERPLTKSGGSAGSTPGTPKTPGQTSGTTPGSSGSASSVTYGRPTAPSLSTRSNRLP